MSLIFVDRQCQTVRLLDCTRYCRCKLVGSSSAFTDAWCNGVCRVGDSNSCSNTYCECVSSKYTIAYLQKKHK